MALLKHVKTTQELDALLETKGNSLVVIDFWATWCAPCHAIAPTFEALSQSHKHVTFVKVDVDASQPIAQKYSVTAMPTFVFIKNHAVIDTLKGANPPGLEAMVKKYAGAPPASSGEGSSSDSVSLLELLDVSQLNCLNESEEHGVKGILSAKRKNSSSSYLESDADEQLLISISFIQTVRVRAISIRTDPPSSGPKKIKLFINRPALGFEDVEDAEEPEASQIIELSDEIVDKGSKIPLRYVRFQSVNSLHIFVSSNQGGEDETRINSIDVFGVPVQLSAVHLTPDFKTNEETW
ncbi:PITH domain-containing protein [Cantharellus anzutake]|uniref:PITH domain-containing protein n=1 Tax=Cantharellus anzutake TaxID=1750568 RepID=UPI0019067E9C|nr:PITH domain-containing protein [Cantharellus anzutake]KAF8344336.1 PITH domain-containing protein [Cantharellus anzutake]